MFSFLLKIYLDEDNMRIYRLLFLTLFLSLNVFAQNENADSTQKEEEPKRLFMTFTPSFGGTYTETSAPPKQQSNFEWLSQLQSTITYEGDSFNFDSDLFLQYGQIHPQGKIPHKTQDDIILNLMPSYRILNTPSVRLFLQVKGETDMGKGEIDTQSTYFLDPLFLTNSVFFGEKKYIVKDKDGGRFLITYGAGYSQQMIIKNRFKLVSEEEHSSDPEYTGGLSALLNIEIHKEIFEGLNFNFSFKSQAIAKNKIYGDLKNFRYSGILLSSIEYGVISINYTNRIVYDNDISPSRNLSQSLTMGLKYSF